MAQEDAWNIQRIQYMGFEKEFWEKYIKGRQDPPSSFWNRIADFHRSHGNANFSLVNDLGAGAGIHSEALGRLFEQVTLTDPSKENLDAAKVFLTRSDSLPEKFTYQVGRAEDENVVDSAKFDMVFAGNTLHWTDASLALPAVADSLKPGGTFVAALFAMPTFKNSKIEESVAELQAHGLQMLRDMGKFPNHDRFMKMHETGYDCVNFSSDTWGYVKRVRLNWPFDEYHHGKNSPMHTITEKGYSRDSHDDCSNEDDLGWSFKTDFQGIKDMIGSTPLPSNPDVAEKLWKEIEDACDGETADGFYQVAIVMATRR